MCNTCNTNCSNCLEAGLSYNYNSSLAAPQPYYLPGYGGYVPQEKYRQGHTFGTNTHRILMDPCIHMSPRSLLTNIHPEYCTDDFGRPGLGADPLLQAHFALVQSRVGSFGRQQYQVDMTPGYTGYVPRYQTILGHTFSPACNRALARFETEQWRDRLFHKELEALDGWRYCYKSKPWESPEVVRAGPGDLQEFSRPRACDCPNQLGLPQNTCGKPGEGIGPLLFPPRKNCGRESLNCETNLLPKKNFCTYGQRRIWGLATEKLNPKPCGLDNWINPWSYANPKRVAPIIYKCCEGQLPHYMGHVPCEKFKIGMTYPKSTMYVREKCLEPILKAPLCYPLPDDF